MKLLSFWRASSPPRQHQNEVQPDPWSGAGNPLLKPTFRPHSVQLVR